MVRKLNAQLIKLTPETLADFRQARPLPGERALKPRRLAQLLKLVQSERFLGLDWARGRCLADGQLYRFDGQHTTQLLTDLLEHPRPEAPFPAGIPITLVEWEFDHLDTDAPAIFNLFNNPLSVRSNLDMMGTYQAFFPDLREIAPNVLMKLMNGIAYFEKQRYERAKKKDAKVGNGPKPTLLLHLDARDAGVELENADYRRFILWAHQLHDLRLFKRTIGRQGLVARLYSDWVENPETAQKFWTLVLSESAPDPDDETRSFAEQLKKMNADRKKVTQEEFFKEAAKAWKRFKRTLDRPDQTAAA